MNEKKRNIIVTKILSIPYSVKHKISKEKIKQWIKSFLTVIVWVVAILIFIYGFLNWTASVVKYFPPYTKPQTVSDILRALVEVDGILLGFVGIVFAQMFGSLMDQQNIVYNKLLDELERESASANAREEYLEAFEEKRNNLAFAMLLTFGLLVLSIFESLKQIAAMSLQDATAYIFTWTYLQNPMTFTLGGVAVLLLSVFAFSLRPPSLRKEAKQEEDDKSEA
jgi:H+/gluconate symporter-like permease